jgi:hypothetical protein
MKTYSENLSELLDEEQELENKVREVFKALGFQV